MTHCRPQRHAIRGSTSARCGGALAIAALLALPGCETLFPGFSLIEPPSAPPLPLLIDAEPFFTAEAPSDPWLVPLLENRDDLTVFLVRVADRVEPHLHEGADETIYIVKGGGDVLIEREWRSVKAGMLIHIPRNTPHAFINKEPGGTIAIATFTPKFLPGDRVAVPYDSEKPR